MSDFDFVFKMAPRVLLASLLAFLAGSTFNAYVLSKMKVAQQGKGFSLRAIVSSLAGECLDSLIFMPIAFWGTPVKNLAWMMLCQVSFKVLYEILILPVTAAVVRKLKAIEAEDVYDRDIRYNPFKIFDFLLWTGKKKDLRPSATRPDTRWIMPRKCSKPSRTCIPGGTIGYVSTALSSLLSAPSQGSRISLR